MAKCRRPSLTDCLLACRKPPATSPSRRTEGRSGPLRPISAPGPSQPVGSSRLVFTGDGENPSDLLAYQYQCHSNVGREGLGRW
ncbi:hypothetical protein LX32DRAFT_225822 [Colletotrichum zoysiae]|uniref:Uncharacterized protein n=1 Tax=Colletotrichum zoysiae TaxID=1216348 RepID=A0AAD9HQG2_9PEZI|nr:hypothetical protein LX32DRAFT_225822 [Colletotrichum zoysiae]